MDRDRAVVQWEALRATYEALGHTVELIEPVPGLPERAAAEGLDPLGYMRKYGVFEVKRDVYAGEDGRWKIELLEIWGVDL